MSLLISWGNGQEKSVQRWFDWHKFQLNFITMFNLSQPESLILYAEFPAFESLNWSGASSTRV